MCFRLLLSSSFLTFHTSKFSRITKKHCPLKPQQCMKDDNIADERGKDRLLPGLVVKKKESISQFYQRHQMFNSTTKNRASNGNSVNLTHSIKSFFLIRNNNHYSLSSKHIILNCNI